MWNFSKYLDFCFKRPWSCMYRLLCLALLLNISNAAMEEGDTCNIKALQGTCLPGSKCTTLDTAIKRNILTKFEIPNCGYTSTEEMICCPILKATPPVLPPKPNSISIEPSVPRFNERPAIRACRRIEEKLGVPIEPHIIGGVPADPGEFPHVVGLGYPRIGRENEYDFNCGGSLIDRRYVLTAAHCVNSRQLEATIVRLGAVNIRNPEEGYVDIGIEDLFIHKNYTGGTKYDDIAVIKLERDAPESDLIQPVCLQTENDEVPENAEYYVTGWGKVHLRNRTLSDILLKAQLQPVSGESCNITFSKEDPFTRQLERGILPSQLCAQGYNGQLKDACEGDSGGPLNLIVDSKQKKYRVAGIVSAGFSCGSNIPGLYTRVTSYLDYIESIVWPNSD